MRNSLKKVHKSSLLIVGIVLLIMALPVCFGVYPELGLTAAALSYLVLVVFYASLLLKFGLASCIEMAICAVTLSILLAILAPVPKRSHWYKEWFPQTSSSIPAKKVTTGARGKTKTSE